MHCDHLKIKSAFRRSVSQQVENYRISPMRVSASEL
jgi:hypothetical protein